MAQPEEGDADVRRLREELGDLHRFNPMVRATIAAGIKEGASRDDVLLRLVRGLAWSTGQLGLAVDRLKRELAAVGPKR